MWKWVVPDCCSVADYFDIRVALGIGEQVYSILLLTIFFVEVYDSMFPSCIIGHTIPQMISIWTSFLLVFLVCYLLFCIYLHEMPCRFQWLVMYLTLARQWTSCSCHWCMPTIASSKYVWILFIILPTILFQCVMHLQGYFHSSVTLNFGKLFARYKWNFFAVSLNKRLEFFESNWAFFAGFGMLTIHYLTTTYFVHILSVWNDLIHFTCVWIFLWQAFTLLGCYWSVSMIMDY